MADLPKTIRVGYRDYTVEWWPTKIASAYGKFGECDNANATLRISDELDGPKTTNTLVHELFHACWHVAGLASEEPEERVVTCLANVLSQVWRDNPELVAFLDAKLKG